MTLQWRVSTLTDFSRGVVIGGPVLDPKAVIGRPVLDPKAVIGGPGSGPFFLNQRTPGPALQKFRQPGPALQKFRQGGGERGSRGSQSVTGGE